MEKKRLRNGNEIRDNSKKHRKFTCMIILSLLEIFMGQHRWFLTDFDLNMKFTKLEESQRNFLNFLIESENDKIVTDVCHKPTVSLQYLHFKSHQPQNSTKLTPPIPWFVGGVPLYLWEKSGKKLPRGIISNILSLTSFVIFNKQRNWISRKKREKMKCQRTKTKLLNIFPLIIYSYKWCNICTIIVKFQNVTRR